MSSFRSVKTIAKLKRAGEKSGGLENSEGGRRRESGKENMAGTFTLSQTPAVFRLLSFPNPSLFSSPAFSIVSTNREPATGYSEKQFLLFCSISDQHQKISKQQGGGEESTWEPHSFLIYWAYVGYYNCVE